MPRPAAALCFAAALALSACASDHRTASGESEAECRAVKPGTVTTANKVCVIENDDPVNPEVEPVTWKGQKFGLCCNGCRPKWEALTAAEKDQAVATALAKSK
jgi:hypothetical protein